MLDLPHCAVPGFSTSAMGAGPLFLGQLPDQREKADFGALKRIPSTSFGSCLGYYFVPDRRFDGPRMQCDQFVGLGLSHVSTSATSIDYYGTLDMAKDLAMIE